MKRLALLLFLLCGSASWTVAAYGAKSLKLAALNIRAFGQTKMERDDVVSNLVKVISAHDLVLIQEVRGRESLAVTQLLRALQQNGYPYYKASISPPLGRNSYREQYAYVYDSRQFTIRKSWVYKDKDDDFERDPYVAHLETDQNSFVLIGLHTSPSTARQEIHALTKVEQNSVAITGNPNIIIMGDLNADCAYFNPEKDKLDRFQRPATIWIKDHQDTTVSQTHCAYDRIISLGPISQKLTRPFVYRFEEELDISYEQAQAISDHYLVSIDLLEERKSSSQLVCGENPYLTPKKYCYATKLNHQRRMPDACCHQ